MSDYRGPYRDRLYRSGNDSDLLDRKRPGRVRLDRIGEYGYVPDEYRSARSRPSRPRPEGHQPQRERVRLDRIGIDNTVEEYWSPGEKATGTGAQPAHKGRKSRKKTARKKIVKKKKKPAAGKSVAGAKKSIAALLLANWMVNRKKRSGQGTRKRKKVKGTSAVSARRLMTPEEKLKRERIVKTAKIFSMVYCLIFVLFAIELLRADILPQTMTCMILAVMSVLSLILFPTLYFNVFKSTRKIIAMGVGGFLIVVCLVLSFNLAGTSSFFSDITESDQQTENYYVVSHRNSDVKKVGDLEGKSVAMFNSDDVNYKNALAQLKSKEKVNYDKIRDLQDIGKRIVNKTLPAAVISSGHYEAICESDKSFQLNARRIYTIKVKMSKQDLSKNVNVTKKPYNIYLSGLDVNGNIDTTSRSDVNMIITVNPQTKKIVLTSIPRDCRIRLAGQKSAPPDKLTHTGIYGIAQTLKSVEKLTGLDMNYYVKVNYSTVKKFINAIGGIDVVSDYEFDTHGQAHYHFKKGKIHLNGNEALAFARERKAFKDGDRQRNKDQAKIMEAIIKKATGSYTILTKYMQILDSCKKYIRINMTQSEIRKIIKMQLAGGYKWDIKNRISQARIPLASVIRRVLIMCTF